MLAIDIVIAQLCAPPRHHSLHHLAAIERRGGEEAAVDRDPLQRLVASLQHCLHGLPGDPLVQDAHLAECRHYQGGAGRECPHFAFRARSGALTVQSDELHLLDAPPRPTGGEDVVQQFTGIHCRWVVTGNTRRENEFDALQRGGAQGCEEVQVSPGAEARTVAQGEFRETVQRAAGQDLAVAVGEGGQVLQGEVVQEREGQGGGARECRDGGGPALTHYLLHLTVTHTMAMAIAIGGGEQQREEGQVVLLYDRAMVASLPLL